MNKYLCRPVQPPRIVIQSWLENQIIQTNGFIVDMFCPLIIIFCTGYSFLPVHNRLDRDSSLNGHTTGGPKSVTRHVSWHRLSCVTVASQRLLRLIAVRSVRDCYYSKCSVLSLVKFTDLAISKARRQRLSRDVGACWSYKGMVDPPSLSSPILSHRSPVDARVSRNKDWH